MHQVNVKNTTKFKSKLEVDELFVKSPMNLKCALSQNERDFLEAVIHLQSTGKYFTSDSLIIANSGLNTTQITKAKRNLMQLEILDIATDKNPQGSRYIVKEDVYNSLIGKLNGILSATERFEYGDKYREEHGLTPIFTNTINTLNRRLKTTIIPSRELITTQETRWCPLSVQEQKELLKQQRDDGVITNEQYYKRIKLIQNK